MIANRLSKNSSNKEIFNEAVGPYNDALARSGFKEKLKYEPPTDKAKSSKKDKRIRDVIWWNPPYNARVATDVGKLFLNMAERHFPEGSTLRKAFNKNNLKMSYRTGKNMRSHIDSHNKAILKNKTEVVKAPCNCKKDPCPVGGECGTSSVIYRADVKSEESKKESKKEEKTMTYFGQTIRKFKDRYTEHKNSFSTPKKILIRNGKPVQIDEQI